jgi:hypothetical protein
LTHSSSSRSTPAPPPASASSTCWAYSPSSRRTCDASVNWRVSLRRRPPASTKGDRREKIRRRCMASDGCQQGCRAISERICISRTGEHPRQTRSLARIIALPRFEAWSKRYSKRKGRREADGAGGMASMLVASGSVNAPISRCRVLLGSSGAAEPPVSRWRASD